MRAPLLSIPLVLAPVVALAAFSCSSSSSNGTTSTTDSGSVDETSDDTGSKPPKDTATADVTPEAPKDPLAGCTLDPGGGDAGVGPSDGGADPTGGADKFTLAMALAGFPDGSGVLKAKITTEMGAIVCELDDANAPVSVANFIGLARGTRPAQKTGTDWTYSHFYDGLKWHRVVDGFVIQGGDPAGTGAGGPGYDLPNEHQVTERLGTLAMAAASAPSGSQFYIVIGAGPKANYNVFGTCDTDVASAIGGVPVNPANDAPKTPIHMQKVEIARCPK